MKESLQLELKKAFGKDAITTLVAFANSEGGRLIVGIDDDGVVCGVEIGAETLQRYIIVIKIFDDRIVFTNPGKLYGKLSVSDLERNDYVSSLRNRLLAEVFYLTGDIERYGTGFVRIREYLMDYPKVSLQIEEIGDFLKVELRNPPPVTPPVTDLERRILTMLHDAPRSSSGDLATRLSMRRDTVKDYLRRLKAKDLLLREGSVRSGSWLLTPAGKAAIEEG